MTEVQFDKTWQAIMADPDLARARRILSFHEIRCILRHAVPDGHKIVPVEPTDEMVQAFWAESRTGQSPHEDAGGFVARCFRRMMGSQETRPPSYAETIKQMIDAAPKAGGLTP